MAQTPKGSVEVGFSKSKRFFYVFTLVVLGLAIYYFSEIKLGVQEIRQVEPLWLMVAIGAQAITYLAAAQVYRRLIALQKVPQQISLLDLYKSAIVLLFINQTIPSATVSGNIYFFRFLLKRGIERTTAFSVIISELLTSYVAIATIIVVLLVLSIVDVYVPSFFRPIFIGGIAIYVIFAIGVSVVAKGDLVLPLVRRLGAIRFLKKKIDSFSEFLSGNQINPWRIAPKTKRTLAVVVVFHMFVYLADAVTIYALFRGLGVVLNPLFVIIGFIATHIVSQIPISPGSLIVYEGSMAFFFVSLGVPVAVAAIVTVTYRILSFWIPIPLGLFFYRSLGAAPDDQDFMDSSSKIT